MFKNESCLPCFSTGVGVNAFLAVLRSRAQLKFLSFAAGLYIDGARSAVPVDPWTTLGRHQRTRGGGDSLLVSPAPTTGLGGFWPNLGSPQYAQLNILSFAAQKSGPDKVSPLSGDALLGREYKVGTSRPRPSHWRNTG